MACAKASHTWEMPNKHNDSKRHHIPKMKFRVRNWKEYDAALRRRGSLTLWVTDEVMGGWRAGPRLTPGGQAYFSDLGIETGLMLRLAFHLPLRQTEGLMSSIFGQLVISLKAPDHTTLSRRAKDLKSISFGCPLPEGPLDLLIDSTGLKVYGAGEWLQEKHGARAKRTWRKLHLAVDANTGMIMASTLTEKEMGDPSQVAPLLDLVKGEIASVTADGAYDGAPTYEAVAARAGDIPVVIPPHVTAVPSPTAGYSPSQRDRHIASIEVNGRLGWQKETGYGRRSLVETTMGRYKAIIGPKLRARSPSGQRAEAAIGVALLNRMLYAGRPDSIRRFGKPS
jgi:transposase